MNQADRDRILQLVAYIRSMDYHSKQAMMDGSNYDRMFDTLQAARRLCNDVVASLPPAWPPDADPTAPNDVVRRKKTIRIVSLNF